MLTLIMQPMHVLSRLTTMVTPVPTMRTPIMQSMHVPSLLTISVTQRTPAPTTLTQII